MVIQHDLRDGPISALHTRYANIPLVHHSMWPEELDGRKKNNNSNKLLQDLKLLIVNTLGDFFQEVFGLGQLVIQLGRGQLRLEDVLR